MKYMFMQDSASNEFQIARDCFNLLAVFVLLVDHKGRIVFANKRACQVLDYNYEYLHGKDLINDLVVKGKQPGMLAALKHLDGSGRSNMVYHLITRNNRERIIDTGTMKIFDDENNYLGFLVSGKDVTEISLVQQDLQEDMDLYNVVFNNLPEINMFLFDRDLRFILARGAEKDNMGLKFDDPENKSLHDITNPTIRKIWEPLFQSILRGEDINTEYKLNSRFYSLRGNPVRNGRNEVSSGIVLVRNITREKMIYNKLEKAKAEARKSADTKTGFLARVSHDLRTPLNAIMGFTEQLLQTRLSERQKEYLSIIDQSTDHLLSLVNDILILSKIETNQVNFESHLFKIKSSVDYVHKALQIKARRKNLQFDIEIDDRADIVLSGDSFRLQQILINLLDNAIKFTEKGGIILRCSVFDETNEEVHIKFEVGDTGPGLSPDHIRNILDPHSQDDRKKPAGLGLPICRNLIELQGGSMSISSKPEEGTTFCFILPYRKGDKSARVVFDPGKTNPDLLKNKRILIVDDDSVNLFLAKTILENFNCMYDAVECGRDAIDKIDSENYDLILLDIQMPDINGIEVAGHVRIKRKDNETKIIALTAAALKDDIIRYKKAGIDDFLIKPFREIYLYNKMCDVMKLSGEPMQKPKTEIILKREISPKPYNLSELKKIANDDETFVNQTLNIFMENSQNAITEFDKYVQDKNWKKIAELAHKILPSYRHLEVDSVVPKLVKLKSETLTESEDKHMSRLVKDTISEIKVVVAAMEKEINSGL